MCGDEPVECYDKNGEGGINPTCVGMNRFIADVLAVQSVLTPHVWG